jgi:hypothetical protein
MLDCNGEEHGREKTAYLMARSKRRKERTGISQCLSMALPNELRTSHEALPPKGFIASQ